MAETELNIILKLLDQASDKIKETMGGIKQETDQVKKSSDEASKSLKDGFKDAGKELKDFRRATFAITAEIAFLGAAVREWGKHNLETKQSLNDLQVNAKTLFAMFGSIFAPAVNALSDAVKANMGWLKGFFKTIQDAYLAVFKAVTFLNQYIIAFVTSLSYGSTIAQAHADALGIAGRAAEELGNKFKAAFAENIPQTEAMKTQLQEMNEALEKLNLMYLTGAISAQQYYDIITGNEVANFQNMQTRLGLMQQMAAQENLMRNQSLMDFTADIQARMGLLKTLQSYHHTIYSSMMDFSNMFIQKFSSGMTSALTSIIMGTKKARDAFKEFGMAMVTSIVEFVVQYGIQMLIAWALSKLIMAWTIAQADALAAAWLPAALFASIATLGAADAAGAAGLASAATAAVGIHAGLKTAIKVSSSASSPSGEMLESGSTGFQEGGRIPEYIVGMGMSSGRRYTFGESGPEWVVPEGKMGRGDILINISVDNPVISKESDIDYLVETISNRLAREVERIR